MRGESKKEGRRETKEVKNKVQLLHRYIHTCIQTHKYAKRHVFKLYIVQFATH